MTGLLAVPTNDARRFEREMQRHRHVERPRDSAAAVTRAFEGGPARPSFDDAEFARVRVATLAIGATVEAPSGGASKSCSSDFSAARSAAAAAVPPFAYGRRDRDPQFVPAGGRGCGEAGRRRSIRWPAVAVCVARGAARAERHGARRGTGRGELPPLGGLSLRRSRARWREGSGVCTPSLPWARALAPGIHNHLRCKSTRGRWLWPGPRQKMRATGRHDRLGDPMPAFHEILFPLDIALKSAGGPERKTEIVALGSGREERNARWAHSRRRYDAGYGVKTLDALSRWSRSSRSGAGGCTAFAGATGSIIPPPRPARASTPLDQVIGAGRRRAQRISSS